MVKKAGRPKLPKSKKRSQILRIRLTNAEARQIRRIARESDLTPAEIARRAVLEIILHDSNR